jgi:hypothetical protein
LVDRATEDGIKATARNARARKKKEEMNERVQLCRCVLLHQTSLHEKRESENAVDLLSEEREKEKKAYLPNPNSMGSLD